MAKPEEAIEPRVALTVEDIAGYFNGQDLESSRLYKAVGGLEVDERILLVLSAVPMCARDLDRVLWQDRELSWKPFVNELHKLEADERITRVSHDGGVFFTAPGTDPDWSAARAICAQETARFKQQEAGVPEPGFDEDELDPTELIPYER